jgi:hypothetical protein
MMALPLNASPEEVDRIRENALKYPDWLRQMTASREKPETPDP